MIKIIHKIYTSVKDYLDNYEDDVTFTQNMLKEYGEKTLNSR